MKGYKDQLNKILVSFHPVKIGGVRLVAADSDFRVNGIRNAALYREKNTWRYSPLTTQLWLVRHGQTDWNVEGRYQGQSDIPLNETGRAQARDLLAGLADQRFRAVYSSDLQRACQTAEILAAGLRLPLHLDPRLREISLGSWEGMLFADINRLYPAEIELRGLHQRDYRVPGGETPAEVAVRVGFAARDIAAAHPDGSVLVVSHGLTLAALYCLAQSISLQTVFSYVPANAEPLVVEWPSEPARFR